MYVVWSMLEHEKGATPVIAALITALEHGSPENIGGGVVDDVHDDVTNVLAVCAGEAPITDWPHASIC
tara:strand:+ start:478 stop:681 length:204 start_codon:yes stop_codon:yes gene_type:complete